jgi:hypothetical protein
MAGGTLEEYVYNILQVHGERDIQLVYHQQRVIRNVE